MFVLSFETVNGKLIEIEIREQYESNRPKDREK